MNSRSNLLLTIFVFLFAITICPKRASAQTPKFKEGDRIEFDSNGAGFSSKFANIEKGTIVQVDAGKFMRYVIQPDATNGFTPSRLTLPIYKQDDAMRALPPQQAPAQTAGAPANKTAAPQTPRPAQGGAIANINNRAINNPVVNNQGAGQAKYKAGDRVEVETVHAGFNSPNAIVSKGTITEVDAGTFMRYVIQLDPLPGKLPVRHTMPMADENCCLRPLAGAAPAIQSETLRVDANETVLADRPLLDCANLQHGGRNGQPLPVELAKELIRCLYEKPSPVGQDGATKMDIVEFAPGAARKWILYQDQGQGTLDTLVYPVHVKYNVKTFYRGRNAVITGKEMTFTCFADKTNLWQCGFATGPNKEGAKEDIVVKPAAR